MAMKEQKLVIPENIIKSMNENLPGDLTMEDLQRLFRGTKIKTPFILNDTLMKSDLANLELSVRSSNSLRRAGFHTVGDLVEGIDSYEDLKRIRNCGATSISEIMAKLLCYQYTIIPKERKSWYMARLLKVNGIIE